MESKPLFDPKVLGPSVEEEKVEREAARREYREFLETIYSDPHCRRDIFGQGLARAFMRYYRVVPVELQDNELKRLMYDLRSIYSEDDSRAVVSGILTEFAAAESWIAALYKFHNSSVDEDIKHGVDHWLDISEDDYGQIKLVAVQVKAVNFLNPLKQPTLYRLDNRSLKTHPIVNHWDLAVNIENPGVAVSRADRLNRKIEQSAEKLVNFADRYGNILPLVMLVQRPSQIKGAPISAYGRPSKQFVDKLYSEMIELLERLD